MSVASRSTLIIACILAIAAAADAQESKPAQPDVAAANQAVLSQLPFADRQDFEDATRGFIATVPDPQNQAYAFVNDGPAPATVNPSLWRQAQLDTANGLFKVTDGVYQVRNYSASEMTIVEGQTGLILIDTLASPCAARIALDLYYAHRPKKPVLAVIYTHNHADHWGGASAVISAADAASGKIKVIAPVNFLRAIVDDSFAANLKGARGQFQFGTGALPVGPQGVVDYGEGEIISRGTGGAGPIIPPNDTIAKPFETRIIDGVTFQFQLALDTEAPSEMFVYLPKSHVLDLGEDDSHTLHNILNISGTYVRNALSWSQALNVALDHFGGDVQILINQHQWPVWGNARARENLADHRDVYKYIHDQTLRMMNEGMAPREIADTLKLPPGLEKDWAVHPYYGSLSLGVMAVYQRYVGWYDGNPANLDRLPPVEEARKAVEYMGGADAAIAKARNDFKAGNYRWVAEVMDQVVFADPSNKAARELAADAFEQMGYGAENGPTRSSYLLAAQKLRSSKADAPRTTPAVSPAILHAMSAGQMFDYLGTRIDGPRAGTAKIVINWRFTDTHETLTSTLEHGALTWISGKSDPHADATLTTARQILEPIILGRKTLADSAAQMTMTGNAKDVSDLWALLVDFKTGIPLVEPR
ncbi:MAG TPA: alkyl sulfatase dimerization domain-containing protein [Rhizomicrobium sp.]|nr:alkyl sulfatase dimerization domain-containing protein [Rhizomicrobium sp.]